MTGETPPLDGWVICPKYGENKVGKEPAPKITMFDVAPADTTKKEDESIREPMFSSQGRKSFQGRKLTSQDDDAGEAFPGFSGASGF